MTLVQPLLESLGNEAWSLSWTGIAGRFVRVFVNGLLVFGPEFFSTAVKSVSVSLTNPATVEVHENTEDELVSAVEVPLSRRPLLWWRTVPLASYYRIYIDDEPFEAVLNQPTSLHHQRILGSDIRIDGGTWRQVRVEAVSSSDVETVSDFIVIFVPGLPLLEPSSVIVSGGGGVFDIELVVS